MEATETAAIETTAEPKDVSTLGGIKAWLAWYNDLDAPTKEQDAKAKQLINKRSAERDALQVADAARRKYDNDYAALFPGETDRQLKIDLLDKAKAMGYQAIVIAGGGIRLLTTAPEDKPEKTTTSTRAPKIHDFSDLPGYELFGKTGIFRDAREIVFAVGGKEFSTKWDNWKTDSRIVGRPESEANKYLAYRYHAWLAKQVIDTVGEDSPLLDPFRRPVTTA